MSIGKRVLIDGLIIVVVGAILFFLDFRYRMNELNVLAASRIVKISGIELKMAACAYADFTKRLAQKDVTVRGLPSRPEEFNVIITKLTKRRGTETRTDDTWSVLFSAGGPMTAGYGFAYEVREGDGQILSAVIQK